jgi:hypothetical protein
MIGFTSEPVTRIKSESPTTFIGISIMPILVVAENRNANRSFILLKDEALLLRQDAEIQSDEARKVHSGESRNAEGLAVAGGAVILTGPVLAVATGVFLNVPAVLIPLGLIGAHSMVKARAVKQALVRNELRSETLSPGQVVHGFLYFQVKRGKERIGNLAVRLVVMSSPQNDRTTFEFDLPHIE